MRSARSTVLSPYIYMSSYRRGHQILDSYIFFKAQRYSNNWRCFSFIGVFRSNGLDRKICHSDLSRHNHPSKLICPTTHSLYLGFISAGVAGRINAFLSAMCHPSMKYRVQFGWGPAFGSTCFIHPGEHCCGLDRKRVSPMLIDPFRLFVQN